MTRGKKAMKKILFSMFAVLAVCVLCAGVSVVPAEAGDYTVSVSTFPIDEAGTMAAQVSGRIKIDQITIANDTAVAQQVTVYEEAGSTETVTAVKVFDIPAAIGTYVYDFPGYNPLIVEDFCVRKSSTGSSVNVGLSYR
jgi:ABC-type glycerol-3-phosphate transport system substrate-binding protein